MTDTSMPPELEDDLRVRAHAIVRSWVRGDVEGLVNLTGDDADELLPMVTKILLDALLRVVSPEVVEQQLDEWFEVRASRRRDDAFARSAPDVMFSAIVARLDLTASFSANPVSVQPLAAGKRSQNGHHAGNSSNAATVARKVATAVATSVIMPVSAATLKFCFRCQRCLRHSSRVIGWTISRSVTP
jgi:hypothetical protein